MTCTQSLDSFHRLKVKTSSDFINPSTVWVQRCRNYGILGSGFRVIIFLLMADFQEGSCGKPSDSFEEKNREALEKRKQKFKITLSL